MIPPIAIYDANVLYVALLRDLLMHLAIAGAVAARWTDAIHDEWTRNVLANRPDLSRERIERTRKLMNAAIPNCLVMGYEPLIETLLLPDPDDRHVLAAAIACEATLIVTFNRRDFPASVLSSHNIEALHPDEFVLRLLNADEATVCLAARRQRILLKNPPKNVDEHLATLEATGLKQSVQRLRRLADKL